MACGANHSGAVTGGQAGEGTVFLWGNGSNFRLGNSDTQEQETPQQVTAMPRIATWLRPSPPAHPIHPLHPRYLHPSPTYPQIYTPTLHTLYTPDPLHPISHPGIAPPLYTPYPIPA